MTQLPNIITLLRIAGSLGLLLCDVTGVAIWIIYALCGLSDIADGWLAGKLKCVTKTGALLLPSHRSEQNNGIPALHCCSHNSMVNHPSRHCGSHCHVRSHTRGTFHKTERSAKVQDLRA
jgi:CDP-diacylglycerol--glycerol-3-phosphate 3-phosphatidyltransferase